MTRPDRTEHSPRVTEREKQPPHAPATRAEMAAETDHDKMTRHPPAAGARADAEAGAGQHKFRPQVSVQDAADAPKAEDRQDTGNFQMVDDQGKKEVRAGPGDAGRSERPEQLEQPADIGKRQGQATQFFLVAGGVFAVIAILFWLL